MAGTPGVIVLFSVLHSLIRVRPDLWRLLPDCPSAELQLFPWAHPKGIFKIALDGNLGSWSSKSGNVYKHLDRFLDYVARFALLIRRGSLQPAVNIYKHSRAITLAAVTNEILDSARTSFLQANCSVLLSSE